MQLLKRSTTIVTAALAAATLTASACAPPQGNWTAAEGDAARVHPSRYRQEKLLGETVARSELRGVSERAISAPVSFRIEREPGVFDLDGRSRAGKGSSDYRRPPRRVDRPCARHPSPNVHTPRTRNREKANMRSRLADFAPPLPMSPGGDRCKLARSVVSLCSIVLLTAGCESSSTGELVPLVDHHQHLLSPTLAKQWKEPEPVDAELLIKRLDKAGISRAVVLSLGYWWGNPAYSPRPDDEYGAVRAENDWTAEQVAKYPDRLIAFCSVNPLREYALAEIDRCAADPRLRNGLKMHFGNSRVNLENAEHVAQLRRVFAAANKHRMPIVAHVWTGDHKILSPFEGRDARTFINEVLSMAPDVIVQIAHMGGSGPMLDPGTKEAMVVLAEAASRGDAAMKNVYFDITTNIHPQSPEADVEFMTARMRQIGMSRLLYGSDAATGGNPTPVEYWRALRNKSGLTPSELETIANNVAPYLRR